MPLAGLTEGLKDISQKVIVCTEVEVMVVSHGFIPKSGPNLLGMGLILFADVLFTELAVEGLLWWLGICEFLPGVHMLVGVYTFPEQLLPLNWAMSMNRNSNKVLLVFSPFEPPPLYHA